MKILTAVLFLLSTLVVHQDVEAQTRGPRYNPNRGGSSTPSRPSSSGNRGPSYNPNRGGTYTPSRPSTPSTPSTGNYTGGSTPRGPRYNPNPGRGTPSTPRTGGTYTPSRPSTPSTPSTGNYTGGSTPRGPRYNPNPGRGTPSTPRTGGTYTPSRPTPSTGGYRPGPTPRGPRYNPTPSRPGPVITRPGTPRGPRYNPTPSNPRYPTTYRRVYQRPIRVHYGTRYYHRPYGYSPIRYAHYYHAPYRNPYYHTVRYYRTYDWYNYVYRLNRNYIYAHWIFWPATGYRNGYWTIDNYPYYVYNGYRYRYSTTDYCNYQLVDSTDHRVVQTYWNQLCNTGYDICSMERDRLNSQMNEYRYFCSETWRDYGYNYSTPSYEDTSYPDYSGDNTCVDADRDGMCDDYEGGSNTCSDYDYDGYCDSETYSEI